MKNNKQLHNYKSNTKWTMEINEYTTNTEKQTYYIKNKIKQTKTGRVILVEK